MKITVREDDLENGTVDPTETSANPDRQQPEASDNPATSPSRSNPRIVDGTVFPFRDPQWEASERSYHTLAVENLNSMTRSYNLMAPNLAKKPYYTLDRELRACFADVAPQLAQEIRERAATPNIKVEVINETTGGVLEHLGGGKARIYDEKRPQYGFREFWRDFFGAWSTR